MKLSNALIISYLLLAGIVGLVGGIGIYTNNLISRGFQDLHTRTGPMLHVLTQTMGEYRRMQQEGLGMTFVASNPHHDVHLHDTDSNTHQHTHAPASGVSSQQHEEVEEFENAYKSALQLLSTFASLCVTAEDQELHAALEKEIHSLYAEVLVIADDYAEGNHRSAEEAWTELEHHEKVFEDLVEYGTDELLARLGNQNERSDHLVTAASRINLVGTGVAVLGAIVLGWAVARRIANPISVIEIGAQRMGSGDLNSRINTRGFREIETLATEFNRMGEQLQRRREEQQRAQRELLQTNQLLKAANERALAAAQAKCDFLANVSHEIRTPMTAILGYTETLFEPELEVSEHRNAIRTIQRNGEFLLQIINDILDLSKIEAGMFEIDMQRFGLIQIVAEVESLMRIRAHAKDLPFDVEYLSEAPETIHTDPMRLRQILLNLLSNAIKFTEKGSVKLQIRLIDDPNTPRLSFRVIDTGIGIASDDLGKLFKPFTQADTSTTREFGGTGLGLSICKRLAELMDGTIHVESEVGVGSKFEVVLPTGSLEGVTRLKNPDSCDHPSSESLNSFEIAPDQLQMRILLAEDGPDNQRLIARVLVKAGAEVDIVENGQEAVELALHARNNGQAYDVVLMDMQMPIMDGYAATLELRDRGCRLPIIAVTAHAIAGDRKKCLDAGCDEYLSKPLDYRQLIAVVAEFVERSRKMRTRV